ncbi:CHAD domain-containing protein [Sphingomonas qilianensis]|uniref:CHAD domain-containing protein n=2 Tax=Sphingomonas qilianensis TaxID=1736690 RepID=A0ABU9XS76_9SPHN
MAQEIELKLELTRDAANAIAVSDVLANAPKISQQCSIYFDTPESRLAKAGLSLRIRESGGKRVQTIKSDRGNAAGLFTRTERERTVQDDTPVLDDATLISPVLQDCADLIAPVFEVQIERRTWTLNEHDAEIELVLDRGEVIAGERRSPICELELELKHGPPTALFAIARRLAAVAPVRIGVLTKAERGYRLAGPVMKAVTAAPILISNEMSSAQAFQHIVQSCLRHFRLNEPLICGDDRAAALHQARVALRRLGSAFAVFKADIDHRGAGLADEVRWLASELGDARNLDVLIERTKPGSLQDQLAAARNRAYDRVAVILALPRARLLFLDLTEWVTTGGGLSATGNGAANDRPLQECAEAALTRFRRKVSRRKHLANATDETRHEIRKTAKKLRYTAEFFAALFKTPRQSRRYKRFLAALETLQDRLGALNDLATAKSMLETLCLAGNRHAAKVSGKGRRKRLLRLAAVAHKDWVGTKQFW